METLSIWWRPVSARCSDATLPCVFHSARARADSPEAITYTRNYLVAFDEERARATTPDQLAAAMKQRFPDAAIAGLLRFSAMAAFR